MQTDQPHARRPRLTPAIADVRRAVRNALGDVDEDTLVLVALSGGADSLALAAATAFEAPRAGIRAGVVVVDHALQDASARVAQDAAAQARALGLDPVVVTRVAVEGGPASRTGGLEAAARAARYGALAAAARDTGAAAVLLGHTLDDQAETVLLGLARGSGAASLSGMPRRSPIPPSPAPHPASPVPSDPPEAVHPSQKPTSGANRSTFVTDETQSRATQGQVGPGREAQGRAPQGHGGGGAGLYLRPLLGVRRATTRAFCADSGLEPWDDPHNDDVSFTRVRVRQQVMPVLEHELGPGIADALARTAELLAEDAEALDAMVREVAEDVCEHVEAGIAISAAALAANPAALRHRLIRYVALSEFGVSLSRQQTLAVAALVTDWHGQKPLDLPGFRVARQGGHVILEAAQETGRLAAREGRE